jgi:hypothetical protein
MAPPPETAPVVGNDLDHIPAPDPDARKPPSLAIIAARRGRDLAGADDDQTDVDPARNGSS